jgi:hypothetical protein
MTKETSALLHETRESDEKEDEKLGGVECAEMDVPKPQQGSAWPDTSLTWGSAQCPIRRNARENQTGEPASDFNMP